MKNMVVKFLAKRWLKGHKGDNLVMGTKVNIPLMGLTEKGLSWYELVGDLTLWVILGGIGYLLFVVGIPILLYYLFSSGWVLVISLFLCFIFGTIMGLVIVVDVIKGLKGEIVESLELMKRGHQSVKDLMNS